MLLTASSAESAIIGRLPLRIAEGSRNKEEEEEEVEEEEGEGEDE